MSKRLFNNSISRHLNSYLFKTACFSAPGKASIDSFSLEKNWKCFHYLAILKASRESVVTIHWKRSVNCSNFNSKLVVWSSTFPHVFYVFFILLQEPHEKTPIYPSTFWAPFGKFSTTSSRKKLGNQNSFGCFDGSRHWIGDLLSRFRIHVGGVPHEIINEFVFYQTGFLVGFWQHFDAVFAKKSG